MHQHATAAPTESFELRFCYLCDADAPHLSTEVGGEYVFQCHVCFASHVEPLPADVAEPGHGRHRVA